MEKEQRNAIQRAVKDARNLLEGDFGSQLLEVFDIDVAKARMADGPGSHLDEEQRFLRSKLTAAIAHKQAAGNDFKEALLLFRREMAFTALNRFVALKLMEARSLVHECVSQGLQSSGFEEFTGLAPALLADPEGSYQLFLQCLFEDVSREVKVLFDPRDPASLLWPRRAALLELLEILNRPELAELWSEDETIGWVYQYFNGNDVKEMRDAVKGGAPRNSRELAVRNQFFTPRYVVEFLTDNTLGRLWYEMRRGETSLRERCHYLVRRPTEIFLNPGEAAPESATGHGESDGETLSQEELLRQPVHIPHRPLKDPREILLLDPACGSMHFGLYAFDLFTVIYEEAWEIAHGSDDASKSTATFAPFVAFAASFADMAAFLREVPRLIVEHNIHGIDIDPRATQIARLSLWLRAQRAWQQIVVAIADRPSINRANVVCAEPMPGEKELLREFVAQEFSAGEQPAFSHLLETIFDQMTLAGEAGSLLRIEKDIRTVIADAKQLWNPGPSYEQASLFSEPDGAVDQAELGLDLSGITDQQFWEQAEQRIYDALQRYAELAESGGGFKRRLFADDAAQGFAFIELCRRRYDVVVMNPPFGESSKSTQALLGVNFPSASGNILCAFILRIAELSQCMGAAGSITDRTWLQKTTYEPFRNIILNGKSILQVIVDLGWGVLDGAQVATSMQVMRCQSTWRQPLLSLDLRDIADSDKAKYARTCPDRNSWKVTPLDIFTLFPDKALAHWCPDSLKSLFQKGTSIDPTFAASRRGISAGDTTFAFRMEWEIPTCLKGQRWSYVQNGGSYSPFYRDTHLVCWSEDDFAALEPLPGARLQNLQYVGNRGLTWAKRSDNLSPSILPAGHCFTDAGNGLFSKDDHDIWMLLGILNSRPFQFTIELFCGQHKGNGYVGKLPLPKIPSESTAELILLSKQCHMLASSLASVHEPNTHFVFPVRDTNAFQANGKGLRCELVAACENDGKTSIRLALLQDRLDSLSVKLLALSDTDAKAVFDSTKYRPSLTASLFTDIPEDTTSYLALRTHLLLSYLLGTTFGRWDIRYATGDQAAPELPDPFAPLPVCPPGQLRNKQGLPASPEDVPASYPVKEIPWDGILVDEPNHPLDVVRRVREVIKIIWSGKNGSNSEAIEHEACEILGVKSLRDYFRNPTCFFADHLKRYSKSRRQAPIYWPLSTGNGSYSVWLYYHRFTPDTLYRVLQEYVDPRISQADRDCFEWHQQVASGGTTDAAQQLQASQALLNDLKQLKAELSLVAPLWKPDLNDGVIINHAILWRITPHAPWQKKVKECWDKLVAGDYDWAHLAFHLWPERVIPKCTNDRSLAIAHGLDATFWCQNRQGKWEPIPLSEEQLAQVVAAHMNHARSDALQRFLASPPPLAATRARAPRAAMSASAGTSRARRTPQALDPELIRQVRLVLTAAPPEGMAKATIAELHATEEAQLTAVIKQLKESGQIEQLGQKRGARYRLSPAGLAAAEAEGGMD